MENIGECMKNCTFTGIDRIIRNIVGMDRLAFAKALSDCR